MTANVSVTAPGSMIRPLTDAELRASPVPITGPLTNAELRAFPMGIIDSERGTWGYVAGVNGTVAIAKGRRVIGITAYSTLGGTLTINGGDAVVVPANSLIHLAPKGNLTAPTVVFSKSVTSYFVESVI